jgi:hypothetical protein
MSKVTTLFSLIVLLFTACAPTPPGSSRFNPIDATLDNHARVTAGREWFIKVRTSGDLVNLSTFDAIFPPFTSSEARIGAVKRSSVNWLRVAGTNTPDNWGVELAAQEAIRTITEVGLTTINLESAFELTFAVKIPVGTTPDNYLLLVFISSQDKPNEALPVPIEIEVLPPQT